MQLIQKFQYSKLERIDGGPGGRVYVDPDGNKLPSVTTILDATKSEESKKALEAWRRYVGQKKAADITKEAAFRGTLMHNYLEQFLLGNNPKSGTNYYHKHAFKMASVIMESYIKPFVDEVWGLESSLYYPGIYAGTTDMVGVYQGQPSIIDFKQTNKLKTDDRVIDYRHQLSAYMAAHNALYNTDIKQTVILMCSVNLEPQCWVVRNTELDESTNIWWQRVAQYHNL